MWGDCCLAKGYTIILTSSHVLYNLCMFVLAAK